MPRRAEARPSPVSPISFPLPIPPKVKEEVVRIWVGLTRFAG